jgi:uncharacterized membrane protein YphA (DoxX/SURF4 family)
MDTNNNSFLGKGRVFEVVQWIAVFLLSGLFLYAGVIKILNVQRLYQDIQSYRMLPDVVAWWMAHYLPWLEILAALVLLWPKLRVSAAVIIGGLILVFMAALLSAWVRGLDVSCGCFGSGGDINRYGWWLLRDAGLLLVAGFVLWNSGAVHLMRNKKSREESFPVFPEAEAE